MEFRHGPVRAGPYELAWREAGAGPAMVLVPCYPVDGRLFEGQLAAAKSGALPGRLIAVDLPGFGRSPMPPSPPERYSVSQLAAAVSALIEHLRLERPVIGGVAIGGTVAAAVAAQPPTPVAGLVLISNRPGVDASVRRSQREAAASRAIHEGAAAMAPMLARAALSPAVDARVFAKVERMIRNADPRAIAALVRAIADRPDLIPMLRRTRCPVIVLAGLDDPFSPSDEVRRLAQGVPGATFVEVPSAGHMAPIEAPKLVTTHLAAFLRSIRGDR